MRLAILGLAVAAVAAPSLASDDDYRDGRIRYAEAGVTIQRASEASAEEAVAHMPFLPGDRVWTDAGGRVEFQFADGSILRLDSRSKLDYTAHDEGRGERLVLRLWAGHLYFRARDRGAAEVEIETPAAYVFAREAGAFRVDADAGETRLSVYEGQADIEADRRRESVNAGERSWVSRGDAPESARRFDVRENDEFAQWYDDRDDRATWSGTSERYLPDAVDPYANELESHGSWYFVAEVGQVWRPYVNSSWAPYTNGRWSWTAYGWTWIPYESWGWAPSHYGRWGYSGAVGWYWIPGSVWSPAWVSWAVGPDYVGWCPLGYQDRPVNGGPRNFGHAAPRGGTTSARIDTGAWNYARRGDLSSPDLAHRRTTPPAAVVSTLHVAESPRARPSRDLRVIDVDQSPRREAAQPRSGRLKPTAGDTVPELRRDPTTTIGFPELRHPRPDTRYEEANSTARDGRGTRDEAAPRDVSTQRRSSERQGDEDADVRATGHPQPSTQRERPGSGTARPSPTATPRARESEPDRDVLRRMFQPLSEPHRSEPRSDEPRTRAPRSEPRSEPRSAPRNEPRSSSPPPRVEQRRAPPPPTQPHAAPRKDRDHP